MFRQSLTYRHIIDTISIKQQSTQIGNAINQGQINFVPFHVFKIILLGHKMLNVTFCLKQIRLNYIFKGRECLPLLKVLSLFL